MIYYAPGLMALDQSLPLKLAKILYTYLFGYYHLWYLIALIIGSCGIWYTSKNNLLENKRFLVLCGMLYLVGCFFNVYDNYIDNEIFIKTEHVMTRLLGNAGRNGLFFGFPMMVIGALAYKNGIQKATNRIGLIISSLILLSEMLLLSFNQVVDMYIAMPLFVYFFILYLMTDPLKMTFKDSSNFLITTDLSLGIYLIHLLVIKQLLPYLNIPTGIFEYITVIFISFLLIFILKKGFKGRSFFNYF